MAEYRGVAVERAKQKLAENKKILEGLDVNVITEVLNGRPQDAITDFVKKVACDMIIVGAHGHSAISSVLMGSVASSLVRHSIAPVLVIPIA